MTRESRLLVGAIACAALAALLTFRASATPTESSPMRPVVVAGSDIAAGRRLGEAEIAGLKTKQVPARFAAPDALEDSIDALDARTMIAIPAGSPLTASALALGGSGGQSYRLRRGERAISVDVVSAPVDHRFASGETVDLYASGFGGGQKTVLVIAGAQVLGVADGPVPEKPRLTLRLAAGQVAAVVRADVFARELRAVQVARN